MNSLSKVKKYFAAAIYMILVFMMLYLNQDGFFLGGFGITYAYLIGLAVIGWALLSFLINPQLNKGILVIRQVYILCLPYLLTVLYSFFIWALKFSGFSNITRGFFYVFYQLIAFAAAGASFYLIGKNAIWYFWGMMVAVNMWRVGMVILQDGFGSFWSELLLLLTSFGNETGETIGHLELHDANFAVFEFLIFIFAYFKEIPYRWAVMGLTLFLSLVGFKRIAVAGILLALLIIWISRVVKKEYIKYFLYIVAGLLCAMGIVYLIIVRSGLFEMLMNRADIDSLGRTDLYQYIEQYYDFGLTYIGNGLGYVSRLLGNLSEAVQSALSESGYIAGELHNDFLRILIDIGVPGFGIWMYSFVFGRLRYMLREEKVQTAIMLLAGVAFLFATYMTDNTYYYYQTNFVFALIVIWQSVFDFEKEEEQENEKDLRKGLKAESTGIGPL